MIFKQNVIHTQKYIYYNIYVYMYDDFIMKIISI